jgi:hypothetical protein
MAAQYTERKDAGLYLALHAISPHRRAEDEVHGVNQGGGTAQERHPRVEKRISWWRWRGEQGIIARTNGHKVGSMVSLAILSHCMLFPHTHSTILYLWRHGEIYPQEVIIHKFGVRCVGG